MRIEKPKQIRQTSEIIWSTFAISDLLKAENLLKSNLQQVMLKFTIDYDLERNRFVLFKLFAHDVNIWEVSCRDIMLIL